jgi:hypothetical protein
MAGMQFFERDLRIATAGLEPAAINAALAKFAKEELTRAISGGAASPQYEKFVNGVKGATEETVKAPGPILYVFSNWPLVIHAALAELTRRVPRRTGRYATSFVVLVDQVVMSDFGRIPADAEVIIFNRQPYTRKMEVGANKTGKRHFDGTKATMARRFSGAFKFETRFLDIRSGVAPGVPYILKHSAGRRRDRAAGQPISYPAIVINALT